MAHRGWVVNASPLILLGKSEQLGLLGMLADQISIPRAVVREVGAKPDGDRTLRAIEAIASFVIIDDEVPYPDILSWDLGAGETQVIAHAVAHGHGRVVLDDREARRCAQSMGLAIIGTLGVVGRAKAMGAIRQAGPAIQRLREAGLYVSDELVARLLREVGE